MIKVGDEAPHTPRSVGALRVSVCICTRNRPDSLAQTLDSLRGSTVEPFEVIVSDDSTSDDTANMVTARYSAVRYQRGPRRGLGANRNFAIDAAIGDVLLFLDDDCHLDARFLENGLERLRGARRPHATIVTGRERNGGRLIAANDQGFLGFQNRTYRPGDELHSVVINATLFPRRVFTHVRFDERLVYGYDEIDVTTRAVASGFEIVRCPAAINHHYPALENRDYYGDHAQSARLYVTFRRYGRTQGKPHKAACFFVLASLHVCVTMAREHGRLGVRRAARVLRVALHDIASDLANG